MTQKISLVVLWLLGSNLSFAQREIHERIEQLLSQELEKGQVHNALLSLYSSTKDIDWHYAKGHFQDSTPVTLDHPFYTASVGKSFTATAIGMLVDQGLIAFDDPVANYLPAEVITGLHVLDGVDHGNDIRIAHLLQHTSGLPDYFYPETVDGSPGIFELMMSDTARFWSPAELVRFSKAHFRPVFVPGAGLYYTDTGYVLLGMILEQVSNLKLHDFFRKFMFEPLKMHHTYLNLYSEPLHPTPRMAEMYAGAAEVSGFTSLSADWAGGAIVSTGKDLITFMRALFEGKIVSAGTLQQMQQWVPETMGMDYGYGLRKIRFKTLFPATPDWWAIGHSGLNGTFCYYFPTQDLYIVGTLNQLEASKAATKLVAEIIAVLSELD